MNLSQIIKSTQKSVNILLSNTKNSVEDREEQDMQLHRLHADIEDIGQQLQLNKECLPEAKSLLNTLKTFELKDLVRSLEIEIAYSSH
jgi:hypothetical protein